MNFLEKSKQDAAARDAKNAADMAKMASGVTAQLRLTLADPHRFAEAEYVRRVWAYTMRPGETIDDVMAPGFFKNLASKFEPRYRLEVYSADLTYFAELMVVGSDHVGAFVELRKIAEHRWPAAERREFDADGYRIEDTGDVMRRLAVVRVSDNKLMKDGFKTKQDAQHYISTSLVARRLAS